MKIRMIACTNDEHGQHNPEEIIDLPEGAALDYINRGLALPETEEVESASTKEASTAKEQPSVAPQKEEATGKGQQSGRHATPPASK